MRHLLQAGLALVASSAAFAQSNDTGACAVPSAIAVQGNSRISTETVRADAGLAAGVAINYRAIQRAIRTLYETGQYEDVVVTCSVDPAGAATLVLHVRERPVLGDVNVAGADKVAPRTVKEKVDLLIGRPVDPALVARAVQRIDSLYESEGYYLAKVTPDSSIMPDGRMRVIFRVEEGHRLAVSGVRINGNRRLSSKEIVSAMKTRPEGFFWFHRGEFDEDKFAADLAEKIPAEYAKHGYVDFQVVRDSLIVDRERGKALVDITVAEGPQYKVGSFDVLGNRRFSSDEIAKFYPFVDEAPTITQRLGSVVRRQRPPSNVFDRGRWEAASQRLRTAYTNEGYIYASVRPVADRAVGPDSQPIVNLRWEIDENRPAIVNRVEIVGNEYTTEACIRSQLVVIPGDVFNQDRLIRSYYNIANLGFFETPLAPPDTRPANDSGDVDLVFRVKEKRTGSVNFGASMGQGTGVGGFVGLTQPNLFGQCKNGSLNWQFGSYINDFTLSFTDPAIKQTQFSGTVSAYRSQSRFRIAELGRSTRTGGSLQFGMPIPHARYSRFFVSYGGESVKYGGGQGTLLGSVGCTHCFRSTLGFSGSHDTRIDMPFATAGGLQTLSADFNGGPLGGTANFQRYRGEVRTYAPLGQIGGAKPGAQPIKFVLGLSGRAGMVFGSPGPFFYSQQFALGGTQYGEPLRGYDEFSITPAGYVTGTDTYNARRESFGSAFMTTTAEVGVRFNQMFYLDAFYDAGNVWKHPRDFDPSRLFRGAGVGVSTVTPLGPLGLDWAYGFDRLDRFGRPNPKWQLHFKLGQLF